MISPNNKETMSGARLTEWAASHKFSKKDAALALGVGRTTYFTYEKMEVLPETVRLACIGYDAQHGEERHQKTIKAIGIIHAATAALQELGT